jgi:hypothetical protein
MCPYIATLCRANVPNITPFIVLQDETWQKKHRKMHRPFCKVEEELTSLARTSGCLKKFKNFKVWCRKETSAISHNAHATEILPRYSWIPHLPATLQDVTSYPTAGITFSRELSGANRLLGSSSEVPENVLKLLKLSEDEMTIIVLNLELPFPLGLYTIKEDHPSTTLVRLLAFLASHAGGAEYGDRKKK